MPIPPFSLSIPWVSQHEPPATTPKFTLGDDQDSDPSSSPAAASPGLVSDDFTSPSSSIFDHVVASTHPPRRRWTLAMAMTDDGMTDEALVEVLERVREQRDASDNNNTTAVWDVDRDTWNWELQWEGDTEGDRHNSNNNNNNNDNDTNIPHTFSLPSFPLQHSLSVPSSLKTAKQWQTARQALLTCRELVRTERHYLSSLNALISSETATTPPPLMIHHASQLASVSERYLARMEADLSTLGVAAAFLDLEKAVEDAFVGWCGVVGGWFETTANNFGLKSVTPRRRLRSGEDISLPGTHSRNGSLRRSVNTWRKNVPTMTALGASNSASFTPSHSSSFLSWRKDRERSAHGPNANGITNPKKPLVRDLAILPTQRVLRYVLLYRGLLAHTPSSSPSCALLVRAVEAATRIAQKCDRAQGSSVKPERSISSLEMTAARTRMVQPKISHARLRKSSAV